MIKEIPNLVSEMYTLSAGSAPPYVPSAPPKRAPSRTGLALIILGILLAVLAAGYALYRKYYVDVAHYHLLVFHPLEDAVGILGLILLVVGLVLYFRR